MPGTTAQLWHHAPFIRLLIPLVAGIVFQWYFFVSLPLLLFAGLIALCLFVAYFFLSDHRKFQLKVWNGVNVHLLLAVAGACLVWLNDIRNNQNWIGHKKAGTVSVQLLEPPVEKQNSFKALAAVQYVKGGKSVEKAAGRIIIYFKKDLSPANLQYGAQLIFTKPLQPIRNAGNPGSFNYQQYSLFQGITHQVYLTAAEFQILTSVKKDPVVDFLFRTRHWVTGVLKKFIDGEKEQGLAEALLIGYKDDLDKNLVESYSNTGVVHIIAISGLHLGLIYWLLLRLTYPLKRKKLLLVRCITIISSLWLFSLLAGAGPSVLRSALMFSCIAIGEAFNKRGSIYNTLALSAFLLLVWNPFWLWDVGFQLSYSAVLSIVIFFRPVYNGQYFSNKALDWLWTLIAVTLAAQILTLPFTIYHFHQFPLLFLLANFIAVPLSSAIVIGEIILVAISFIPILAEAAGWLLSALIGLMNRYVERLSDVSFAVWKNLSISIPQTLLLLGVITCLSYWLMEKERKALWPAMFCLLGFFSLRSLSFIKAENQKKLIVYNVPKHKAIDIIMGRQYAFWGDKELEQDDFVRNFHLQPSRILHRTTPDSALRGREYLAGEKHILLVDAPVGFRKRRLERKADLVILSGRAAVSMTHLAMLGAKQVVIDGSVPRWKAGQWKKDCDSLHLSHHDVSEKGAFVMNLR